MLDLEIKEQFEQLGLCEQCAYDFPDSIEENMRALAEQVKRDRYAMARALLYLRQTHDSDEWHNEEYVVAEPINLLINALGTKDVGPILEKHNES